MVSVGSLENKIMIVHVLNEAKLALQITVMVIH